MSRAVDVVTSIAATLARLGSAASVTKLGARPEKPLEIYDFEACPFCRKAREALSMLDLDVVVYPCPKGGPRYRHEAEKRGGKAQFPYLVDPNTGKELYESNDIIRYLFDQYGDGSVPMLLASGPINDISSIIASAWRGTSGSQYTPARAPEQPLELWSYEASPFCRLVREELTCLELPYVLHNVAKGSAQRDAFVTRAGNMMVPYLADPNTGVEMFESADIVEYLRKTYAIPAD